MARFARFDPARLALYLVTDSQLCAICAAADPQAAARKLKILLDAAHRPH